MKWKDIDIKTWHFKHLQETSNEAESFEIHLVTKEAHSNLDFVNVGEDTISMGVRFKVWIPNFRRDLYCSGVEEY